jgi:uncharacterized membrane protein (GlpM family)
MRKAFIIIASIFAVIGVIFTFLPLGTIPLFPIAIAIITSLIAFKLSTVDKKRFPRIILLISIISFLVVIGKAVLIKDKVVLDQQFEIKKEESKKEDIKDLEGL